jgi:hypothetical protein
MSPLGQEVSPSARGSVSVADVGLLLQSEGLRLGIDKLVLYSEPLQLCAWEFDTTSVIHGEVSQGAGLKYFPLPSGHDVRVSLRVSPEGVPFRMQTSFNPSQDRPLVALPDALALAEEVWAETAQLVEHAHPVADARIGRVDVAADFAPIEEMDAVFCALNMAAPKKHWTTQAIASTGTRGGATVKHSTKTAGEITAYDKSAQARLSVPTLRIEAKVFKTARKKLGLQYVRDLNDRSVRQAFDTLVEPFVAALVHRPLAAVAPQGVRHRKVVEAIGELRLRELGLEGVLPLSSERRRELREIIRHLGILKTEDLGKPRPGNP